MSYYSNNKLVDDNKNTAWKLALDLVPEGSSVFDVGCSVGTFGHELIKRKNCTVDGIEPDKSDAEKAKTKLRKVEAITAEDQKLFELFPNKYDVISFIDVIEHLANPVETLKRVSPMLKKDGVILFSIPNMAHLSVRLALLKGKFTYTQTGLLDQTHLHYFTGEYIQEIFQNADYTIDKFEGTSFTYPEFQVAELLRGVGLKNTKRFIEVINETQGNIYQYVGTARLNANAQSKNHAAIPKTNQHEKDYKIVLDTIEGYKNHAKHLEKAVEHKEQHIKNLELIVGEYNKLRNKPIYRIAMSIKKKINIKG